VVHRELVDADGVATGTVRQEDLLTHRVQLRFEQAVHSPQVLFQVYAEDGTFVYSMQTPLGEQWRAFSAGEEAAVAVRFVPRFGGGTFRPVVVVTSIDASTTFVHDDGPAFFVEPRRGASGLCDLEATIGIDDEDRTEYRQPRFGGSYRAAVEGQ
jgi:hypothetical protein